MKFTLINSAVRSRAAAAVYDAEEGSVVTIKAGDPRNLEQNARLWAMLTDISRQLPWHGIKLSAEEYKDLLSAGLVKTRVVPNVEGTGFVILGQRTSRMSKREFSDLIEFVTAFGAERGVEWSEYGSDDLK